MCEYGVFGATDEECQQSRPDDRMADCRKQDISKHAPYETLLRRPTADPRRNWRWMCPCTPLTDHTVFSLLR
jgi:hypothetical protein